MDETLRSQIVNVEILARENQEYMALLEQCLSFEDALLEVMQAITLQQACVIYDFFSAYTDLQELRLKIACQNTVFPD